VEGGNVAPNVKAHQCPQCPSGFNLVGQLNRHVKQVHGGGEKKYLKHIKKDGKYLCKVCEEGFTHPTKLKNHIIKKHKEADLEAAQIPMELVIGSKREPAVAKKMTDLEEEKADRLIFSAVRVTGHIYDAVVNAAVHCPRLYQLLMIGVPGKEWEQALYLPVSNVTVLEGMMRYWRLEDFSLDSSLGQAFNFEFSIMESAHSKGLTHLLRLQPFDTFFSRWAVCMTIRGYSTTLREYLKKNRKHRELTEIML